MQEAHAYKRAAERAEAEALEYRKRASEMAKKAKDHIEDLEEDDLI